MGIRVMETGELEGQEIAVGSGSNLAIALNVLPPSRRRDMRVFYAFCRVVDDLADEPGLPLSSRRDGLKMWRQALLSGRDSGTDVPLVKAVRRVLAKYEVPPELACEIVTGCEMDLDGIRYRTWPELRQYCYRVASAVGLVSARIFGGIACESYAEDLGLALQLTNILRDSAEDFSVSGRVYLPLDELEEYGVKLGSWVTSKPDRWDDLMRFQSQRAWGFFRSATDSLPGSQQRVMVAAEIMKAVYSRLLIKMERDGFRVWERHYRLGRMHKLWLMASVFVRACWGSEHSGSGLDALSIRP